MEVVTSLLKVALLGAVVALYWRPLEIAKAVGVPPPEGGFQPAQVQVVRFLLSIMAYMSALSSASSWFATVLVLIALQTVCMAIGITDQRVLNDALGGVLDAASEKQLFETSAVVLYGLLVAVLLFGGRTNGKNYHRRRLMAFYAKHNPDKLADVGKILKKYEGKEELLFSRLHRKYSRVLSHTPAEDAVDDLDHNGDDQDEDVAPEGAFIEEVEYIQATSSSSPTSSSTSSYSKTVVSSSKTTTTFSASNDDDEDDGGDEASLPMLQPRVKSAVTKSPVGSAKSPSVPPSPALSQSAGGTGSKAGSAAGSAANSPPRSPGAGPSQANSVRKASEDARRALQERVQQRVAQLQKKKK